MTKNQKKKRLKELKQREKERKLAGDAGAMNRAPTDAERVAANPHLAAGHGHSTPYDPAQDPKSEVSKWPPERRAGVRAQRGLEDARDEIERSKSDELTDAEARAMLVRAARSLDRVVEITDRALSKVPPRRLEEAAGILREESAGEGSPGRSRRGADPVVTLMKINNTSARLLKQVLKITNPDVHKLARAA